MIRDPRGKAGADGDLAAAPEPIDDASSQELAEQLATVARLPQSIRGGIVSPEDLGLAEALLLLTLTSGADDDGVIGPTHSWRIPLAKFRFDHRMRSAWEVLYQSEILRPHRSSPTTAFSWSDTGHPTPLWQLAHWYVARGMPATTGAESCAATRTALEAAFMSPQWPAGWIDEAHNLAHTLICAEGLDYIAYCLRARGLPEPTPAIGKRLEEAMFEAAADYGIGQLIYLAWKPMADLAEPAGTAGAGSGSGPTQAAAARAVTSAVSNFATRGPKHRANDWTVQVYDQPADLPVSIAVTELFRALGLAVSTGTVADIAEAAWSRADQATRDHAEWVDREEEILQAGPLPDGAWEAVLQDLDDESALMPYEASGWPEGARSAFEEHEAVRRDLFVGVADYLRRADSEFHLDERARLIATCHDGAILAAHMIVLQQQKTTDLGEAIAAGSELQNCIAAAYERAKTSK